MGTCGQQFLLQNSGKRPQASLVQGVFLINEGFPLTFFNIDIPGFEFGDEIFIESGSESSFFLELKPFGSEGGSPTGAVFGVRFEHALPFWSPLFEPTTPKTDVSDLVFEYHLHELGRFVIFDLLEGVAEVWGVIKVGLFEGQVHRADPIERVADFSSRHPKMIVEREIAKFSSHSFDMSSVKSEVSLFIDENVGKTFAKSFVGLGEG